MKDEKDEIEFGYSLRMSNDDKTANIQVRYDDVLTRRILAECLRSLADEVEFNAPEGLDS